jgi:hypothetical protein
MFLCVYMYLSPSAERKREKRKEKKRKEKGTPFCNEWMKCKWGISIRTIFNLLIFFEREWVILKLKNDIEDKENGYLCLMSSQTQHIKSKYIFFSFLFHIIIILFQVLFLYAFYYFNFFNNKVICVFLMEKKGISTTKENKNRENKHKSKSP